MSDPRTERQRNDHAETAGCRRCHDENWIRVGDDPAHVEREMHRRNTTNREAVAKSVYPCPSCNVGGYIRWRDGHYAPDHTCAMCDGLRRGDPKAREEMARLIAAFVPPPMPGAARNFSEPSRPFEDF